MEDAVSTFGLKSAVLIVIARYGVHVPTEFKDIILSYLSISYTMVDSQCEILWANNSGEIVGHHPIANYGESGYVPAKQEIISQHRLRPKMISLWIKNSMTADAKRKLRAFSTACTFNKKYDGAAMFLSL